MIYWAMFDATHPNGPPTDHIKTQVTAKRDVQTPVQPAQAKQAHTGWTPINLGGEGARSLTSPNTPMRQNSATLDVNQSALAVDSAECRNLWFEFNPDAAGNLPRLRIPGEEETSELQWSKPSKTPAARLRASPTQQQKQLAAAAGTTPSRSMPGAPPATPQGSDGRIKQANSAEQRKAAAEQMRDADVHRRMFSV